jgi:nucleoside-diphosphate-sugar epimerase
MDNPKDGAVKKKLLITGANGFIGKVLLEQLDPGDYKKIPVVRKKTGLKNEIVIDFCDDNLSSLIAALPSVDVVVHLGARIGWDGSLRQDLFIPNVLATGELARWAQKKKAYFIFASAAIVCGTKNIAIGCKSKLDPDTDYGYSKWLAEELIKFSGAAHTILRISGVFGKYGPGHLGINRAITDALNGIAPVLCGSGKIRRNYLYVKDLAQVIKFCIENKISGTHLVAGSGVNTVYEMLKTICTSFLPGKALKFRDGPDGLDQVIEHSALLPKGRTFKNAIRDIADDIGKASL